MKTRFGFLMALALVACSDELEPADYSSHEGVRERNSAVFLDGPVPYDRDVPRLWFGSLYEPAGNERLLAPNGITMNFFVFDTNNDGSGTFTVVPGVQTTSDRVQGTISNRVVLAGLGFFGFGFFWEVPRDISQYEEFHISLKSTSTRTTSLDEIQLEFASGPPTPATPGTPPLPGFVSVSVNATDFGYVNDGEWHSLTIPVQTLIDQGYDPTSVRSPIVVSGGASNFGETFLIDDLYYLDSVPDPQ